MAQAVDSDRNRLGPAEGGPAGQHEDQWHDDRAERIDVLERIESEPTRTLGRVVAAPERDNAVADLVADHCGNERQQEYQRVLVENVVTNREHDDTDCDRRDDDVCGEPLVGPERAPPRSGGQRRTEAQSMQRAVAG